MKRVSCRHFPLLLPLLPIGSRGGAARRAPFGRRFTRDANFGEIGAISQKPFARERLWSLHVEASRSEEHVLPIRSTNLQLPPLPQFVRQRLIRGVPFTRPVELMRGALITSIWKTNRKGRGRKNERYGKRKQVGANGSDGQTQNESDHTPGAGKAPTRKLHTLSSKAGLPADRSLCVKQRVAALVHTLPLAFALWTQRPQG